MSQRRRLEIRLPDPSLQRSAFCDRFSQAHRHKAALSCLTLYRVSIVDLAALLIGRLSCMHMRVASRSHYRGVDLDNTTSDFDARDMLAAVQRGLILRRNPSIQRGEPQKVRGVTMCQCCDSSTERRIMCTLDTEGCPSPWGGGAKVCVTAHEQLDTNPGHKRIGKLT